MRNNTGIKELEFHYSQQVMFTLFNNRDFRLNKINVTIPYLQNLQIFEYRYFFIEVFASLNDMKVRINGY